MKPNIIFSGTQIGKDFPYLHFEQLDCNYIGRNTCLGRYEEYLFKFCYYHNIASELLKLVENFRTVFDNAILNLENRTNLLTEFRSKLFLENKPNEYEKLLIYKIQFEKRFEGYKQGTTTGKSFYECLFKRFNSSLGSDLNTLVEGFSTTSFGKENWTDPFLYIPKYDTLESFVSTCSRVEKTKFCINFNTFDPVKDYQILDAIDYLYSYAKFDVENKKHLSIEWLGNSFTEVKPNFWTGSVHYELLLETT